LTNEQVVKRFLFDLEMNRFKPIDDKKSNTFLFKSENMNFYDYSKLDDIFHSIGILNYNYAVPNYEYLRCMLGLCIDEFGAYSFYVGFDLSGNSMTHGFIKQDSFYNHLPEYINDYTIEKESDIDD